MDQLSDAERRVWARLPAGAREALNGLSGSELQTLLLSVGRERAARQKASDVVRRWREDRFVRPAGVDPRLIAAVDERLWALLPEQFDAVQLSPVVPLGTCTAVAPVSQNRIVTAMRAVEVLSDPTNALAVEAADRRSRQGRAGEVHLATSQQVLRAQVFGPGMEAHFRLFALVSSARDSGSKHTEERLLRLHLDYWERVLDDLLPGQEPVVAYSNGGGPELAERADHERERAHGYYTAGRLMIAVGDVELGDGGFTDWTAQLLGDAKERCLVSCLSSQRIAARQARMAA